MKCGDAEKPQKPQKQGAHLFQPAATGEVREGSRRSLR